VKNKKLLLINPCSENQPKFKFFPPIALGMIKALTPPNWEVTIIDENTEDISTTNYDLVAITTTHHINKAYKIAEIFKQKNITVVMGGAHASALPEEVANYADAVIIGDAEPLWHLVINDFEAGNLKKIYNSKNLSYDFVIPILKNFDNKYFAYALETSRGCVNNCIFCGIHIPFHKAYKRKPIELIISELKSTNNPFVFIIDNNFYGNDDEYLFLLFNELIHQKINKTIFAAVSVGFFKNEKLVKKASECGLKMLFVGFESDTVQSLNELNKKNYSAANNMFEEYKYMVDLSHKHGILISTQVIIGIENDTEEIIKKRFDFFSKLNLDELSCVILTPLPNSPLFKKFKVDGALLFTNFPDDWVNYDYCKNAFKHKNLSKEKLENLQLQMNIKYAPNLKKMLRSFLISKSIKGFFFYFGYCYYFFNFNNKYIYTLLRIYAAFKGLSFPKKPR